MRKGIKTGGRKKGTANKLTLSHRELIQSIFDSEVRSGKIERELKKLEGKDYTDAIFKLTGFVIPKLNSVDVIQTNTGVKQIIVVRATDSLPMRKTGATEGKVSQRVSQT